MLCPLGKNSYRQICLAPSWGMINQGFIGCQIELKSAERGRESVAGPKSVRNLKTSPLWERKKIMRRSTHSLSIDQQVAAWKAHLIGKWKCVIFSGLYVVADSHRYYPERTKFRIRLPAPSPSLGFTPISRMRRLKIGGL